MEGKDAIINKILEDANAQAVSIISAAEGKAAEVFSAVQKDIAEYSGAAVAVAKKEGEELVKRRLTVADLEVKKMKLSAKKDIINSAFDKAGEALKALTAAKYKKLIEGMLLKYADNGDVVIISQKDSGAITAALIASVAKKKNIALSLSEEFGNFEGGIILKGKGMDKNLTFEVELKLLKENLETSVANMIFGKE